MVKLRNKVNLRNWGYVSTYNMTHYISKFIRTNLGCFQNTSSIEKKKKTYINYMNIHWSDIKYHEQITSL